MSSALAFWGYNQAAEWVGRNNEAVGATATIGLLAAVFCCSTGVFLYVRAKNNKVKAERARVAKQLKKLRREKRSKSGSGRSDSGEE